MHNLSKKGKKDKEEVKEEVVEEESSEETTEEIEEEEEAPPQQMSLMDLLGGGQGADTPEARSIMFVGEVTEERAADLISALLVLSQTKAPDAERAEPIKLYVSTYGGSADEMFGNL